MKLAPLLAVLGLVLATTTATADSAPTRAELLRVHEELGEHITEAEATFARYASAAQKVSALYAKLDEKATALRKAGAACTSGCGAEQAKALVAAAKDMEQAQMSFNLQYLQLQSQMQNENRAYTAVSNIMRTKHETVKGSISKIR
jgi:Skp family chaperone for outer membrane proteins